VGDQTGLRALVVLAERQHGLVTRKQAAALAVPRRTLQRRIEEGAWVPHGPGVLRLVGTPASRMLLARSVLLTQPDALITGAAALELQAGQPVAGLPDGPVWLVSPRLNRPGVRVVPHPDVAVRKWEGGTVLPADACLAADLVRLLPESAARDAAHLMLQGRRVTTGDLLRESAKLRSHLGGAQLAAIAADLSTGSHAESEAELHALLERAGLTGWHANYGVSVTSGTRYIDVAFPQFMLAIEVDGRAFHTDDPVFESDRDRQNELSLDGWTVLRFTWKRLTGDPDGVLRDIVTALEQAARNVP
jgi:very-short-patch-repair endonuclease